MATNTGKDRKTGDILAEQLECLFSDFVVPSPVAGADSLDQQEVTASDHEIMTSYAPSLPDQVSDTEPSEAKPLPQPVFARGTLIRAVIAVTALMTIGAVVLYNQGWAAQSNTQSAQPIDRKRASLFAVSPTAAGARVVPLVETEAARVEAAAGPEIVAVVERPTTPITTTSGPNRSSVPSATPTRSAALTATRTPSISRSNSETTRVIRNTTPTKVIPTSTPTSEPATPTLVPARPVQPETATPVPAWSIGLGAIPTPVPRLPMPDQAINIVLLGSDQRPYETEWRTDVIIVVSVNPELPSVSMLSIPRDTWLYIPNWTYQRINLADTHGAQVGYPGGGPGLVKATIEYNFGIHVDYFARVDFAGLMRLVDTLSGIDVLLDCPVADGFPDDPITEDPSLVTQISYPEPGLYHLDGKHALWLARSRKTTSEFARSRRQHRILQGIWAKAKEMGYLGQLPDLWQELTDTVQTDLSLDDVLWLTTIGLQMEPSQIRSGFIDGRYLTAWVTPRGANVLLPHTEAILQAMEQHFNPYPYKAPQGLSHVDVWNGSGHEDWGLLAADKLLRNGFGVASIHDVDELYEKTTVVDFAGTRKGSPLPLLLELFNADSSHVAMEPGTATKAPFRLIVGTDYQPCERPKPAQWIPTPTPPDTSIGD